MENNIINPTDLQLKDEFVISIKRVSKATTGGRRMRFRAIVVVGDGNGHVGIGFGRANEVASAVDKATCALPSPTTTIALNLILLPPVVALETLLIEITNSSFNCKSVGFIMLFSIKYPFIKS
jgi:ribosomal protein S5